MRRFIQAITLAMLALMPVACLQQQASAKKETEKKKAAPPLYLGSVHQVYPKMNCALLRIIGPLPTPGSTLIAHPADGSNSRVANLYVTADNSDGKSRGFVMAEVRAGTVLRGDRVFVYRDLTPQENEAEDEMEEALNDLAPDLPSNMDLPADNEVDTTPQTVESPADQGEAPTPPPATKPGKKNKPGKLPDRAPSYLDDVPDDISGWE